MEHTIIASFETRRDAEVAVEHLVQQHGIERSDVFIQPEGAANSAGSKLAGADIESGHPGVEKHGDPALNGLSRSRWTATERTFGRWSTP